MAKSDMTDGHFLMAARSTPKEVIAAYRHFYNHVRSRRALDFKTPAEYLATDKVA